MNKYIKGFLAIGLATSLALNLENLVIKSNQIAHKKISRTINAKSLTLGYQLSSRSYAEWIRFAERE